jgi:uncharacterized protein
MPNRLIHETSPYLLQHAHNPVNWYPWGAEALEKAQQENKPILVSIGYSACHWCHVMERESFEDPETATLMNEHFVNIKIDREERPDLDHIYMDAVQAMTGSGGWPLNVFLTPDARPFYGGTYFPPKPAFNRSSWKEVLLGVSRAFTERRDEIESQANNLTEHLWQSNNFGIKTGALGPDGSALSKEDIHQLFQNLMKNADREEGGFGRAPKFPQSFSIQFLLHYHYYSGNEEALKQACLSLDKMIRGGIYDQLGGGFARYATDNEWLVPHFEKMLYDNALLIAVLAEAFQLTQKQLYKRTIVQTIEFLEREMLSPEGGFYAALDADSEGVEGKYYVWTRQEVEGLLKEDAALFCEYYDITERGNWEHKNILNCKYDLDEYASTKNLSVAALLSKINNVRALLLAEREKRVRPQLDDKILLGWNALLVTAYCKASAALEEKEYKFRAIQTMDFLWQRMKTPQGFQHSFKNGESRHPAFLDDYAYLIQALIHLQEITAEPGYLWKAKEVLEFVENNFGEEETGYFFFTHANQTDVIVRKKEVYDGATPSGNAIMALNLCYLAIIFDNQGWRDRSVKMLAGLQQAVTKYPSSFGVWAYLLQAMTNGIPEIALVGDNFESRQSAFLRSFTPFRVFQSASLSDKRFPLVSGKPRSAKPQFYLCKHYTCQNPVSEVDELIQQIRSV